MSSNSSYPHRVSLLLLVLTTGRILGVRFKILVLLQYTRTVVGTSKSMAQQCSDQSFPLESNPVESNAPEAVNHHILSQPSAPSTFSDHRPCPI